MVQRLRGLSLEPMFALIVGQAAIRARAGLEAIAAYRAETAGLDPEPPPDSWRRLGAAVSRPAARHGPVPPYESLYTGDVQGTRVMARSWPPTGKPWRRPCDGVHDQPDHLGLEMGFLAFLARRSGRPGRPARRSGHRCSRPPRSFSRRTRAAGDAFCDAAGARGATSFYRGALLLTKAVLQG